VLVGEGGWWWCPRELFRELFGRTARDADQDAGERSVIMTVTVSVRSFLSRGSAECRLRACAFGIVSRLTKGWAWNGRYAAWCLVRGESLFW